MKALGVAYLDLLRFTDLLLDKVDRRDFVAGIVGQNVVLEGMAFAVLEMLHALSKGSNVKFAHTLAGVIADERRHVGFGENRIGALIRRHPERKADVERLQREMSYHMLAAFAVVFRGGATPPERSCLGREPARADYRGLALEAASPQELEQALAATVLADFKRRLERIGVEYQTPPRP
ncbi:MAG: hypothetical protein AB1689_05365 [Thermodesulfobacteriota bacterium]